MNKKSSRRECLQADATATNSEVGVSPNSVLPTVKNNSRSTQAVQTVFGHGYSPEEIERAKRTLYRARCWRRDNPQAWALIVSHALDLAAKGQPIAAQTLIEAVRKKAFVDRFGNDTRTNNDYRSVFARWLIIEHPETAQYIEVRRSVFDVLIGGRND